MQATTSRGSWVLLLFLVSALVVAPLPLGANRIWAWTILEVIIFSLVIAACLWALKSNPKFLNVPSEPALIGLGVWLTYLAAYLLPVPYFIAENVSPRVFDSYRHIYDVLSLDTSYVPLTLDRNLTLQALLKQGMYVGVFFLVLTLVTNRARLKFLLYAILFAGVFEVSLALAARAMDVDLTPRELMDGHWNVLRGTFVNRNHFGAFLAMSAATGIGLTLNYIDRSHDAATIRGKIASLFGRINGAAVVTGAAVVLVAAGMVMSTSRGAVGAFFVALCITLAISAVARGWRSRELFMVWPLAFMVIGGLAWGGSKSLLNRVFTPGLFMDERWIQWAATNDLIRDYWLMGSGPGTYVQAFTAYKDSRFRPLLYDYAHNDYLQLLAEYGVLGSALMAVIVGYILWRLVRAFVLRRDILVRGALFASLTGMVALMIHSMVEFNFQIPANALYFWTLAGLGLAATSLPGEREKGTSVARDFESGSRAGDG